MFCCVFYLVVYLLIGDFASFADCFGYLVVIGLFVRGCVGLLSCCLCYVLVRVPVAGLLCFTA